MKRFLAAAAIAASMLTLGAHAAEVDFTKVLFDQDNQPIKDNDGKVLTLGRAAMMGLMTGYQDDAQQPGGPDMALKKVRRGNLGLRVYEAAKPIDVSPEDLVLIREYVAKLYPPLVVARAMPLLEGKAALGAMPTTGIVK